MLRKRQILILRHSAEASGGEHRHLIALRFALAISLLSFAISGCRAFNSSNHATIVADFPGSNPLEADQLNQKGIRCVQKNQLSKAQFHFDAAIKADPRFGPAYNNLGLVFFHQQDFFEATRAFEAASEYLPRNPEPLNNLGLVMETVARPDDAIDLYWQAHELAPTNAEYLGNLLRARVRLGQIDDELLSQLHSLLMYEKRPEWQDWAREQLALLNNPNLDRGPAQPSSDPLGSLSGKSSETTDATKSRSDSSKLDTFKPTNPTLSPDSNLRLPPVFPEELPSLETMQGIPSVPSTRKPTLAPPAAFPPALPPPARMPSSILEPLE